MEAIPCFLVLTMEVIQNLVILTGPVQLLGSSGVTLVFHLLVSAWVSNSASFALLNRSPC